MPVLGDWTGVVSRLGVFPGPATAGLSLISKRPGEIIRGWHHIKWAATRATCAVPSATGQMVTEKRANSYQPPRTRCATRDVLLTVLYTNACRVFSSLSFSIGQLYLAVEKHGMQRQRTSNDNRSHRHRTIDECHFGRTATRLRSTFLGSERCLVCTVCRHRVPRPEKRETKKPSTRWHGVTTAQQIASSCL
jgi:hypothetical protein